MTVFIISNVQISKINTYIEVVGVFGSYEELGQTYYYLAVDDIAFS